MENHPLASHMSWVHGQEREGRGWYALIDPSTGEELARASIADQRLVDAALASAHDALGGWRSMPSPQRSSLLHTLAEKVREEQGALAALLSREAGKPLQAALDEVLSAAFLIDYFAEENLRLCGQIPLLGYPREQVLIVREPVGVVVAITPFNYPLSTLAAKMAPALAVGCTVVAKPDEHTPLSTLKLAQLAVDAGMPPGVFNVVTGSGAATGRLLVDHPLPASSPLRGAPKSVRKSRR